MRSLEPASAILGRKYAVHMKRFGYAFKFLGAKILKIESCRYETSRRFRDEYRVGSAKGLQTCGNIRRLSNRIHRPRGTTVSNFTDDDRARANTHSRSQGNWP